MRHSIDPSGLLAKAHSLVPAFLDELRHLVDVDCGTYTPVGVNHIADHCEAHFLRSGWEVERVKHHPTSDERQLGDIVVGRLRTGPGAPRRLLLIGHMDTVFPVGTAAARPFMVTGDRATGPGVCDMKAGLLAGFYAVDILRALHPKSDLDLTYVCNPDEEIGSTFSKPFIQAIARDVDICLVLEAGRENGNIVTARKGMSTYRIDMLGRAAHAGVEPKAGRSAILEAAHKIVALHALNGHWPGASVNPGVVSGGTRPNVVAAQCVLDVDLRAADDTTFDIVGDEVLRIAGRTTVEGVTSTVRLLQEHRPMTKDSGGNRLATLTQEICRELGFDVQDQATGGASDANTTAAMGIPTLDGLGPVGGAPHSAEEWLDVASIGPRLAMLTMLIDRTANNQDAGG